MSKMHWLWQKRFFLTSPFLISTSPVPALPRSRRSSLGGGCRSFLSAGMDQRADQKRSLNGQRCKSRCRYQSSARQLTRSSRPLVRHRPVLTALRRIFNEPHRPPHHVCMARFETLPATSGTPSTDIISRCDWSGWCKKRKDRENCECNMAKRHGTFPALQMTTKNDPTGKSAVLFSRWPVQPLSQKYSGFPKWQISSISTPSRPTQRGVAQRHGRGAGCGGR